MDVQFTNGVRDYLCVECRKGVCEEGEYVVAAAHSGCKCGRCARFRAFRELVVAVDDLLKSIKEEADEPQGIVSHAIATRHDIVRRLITSDMYQSHLGIRL